MMNQETMEDTKSNYTKLHESETESTLPQLVAGVPVKTGIPNQVKVISPSDLPEGYQFTVVANHRALIVSVVSNGYGQLKFYLQHSNCCFFVWVCILYLVYFKYNANLIKSRLVVSSKEITSWLP
jgi:hypothetical protein